MLRSPITPLRVVVALAAALAVPAPARSQPAPFALVDDVRPAPAALARTAALSESLFMATRVPEMEAALAAALAAARAGDDSAAELWVLRRTAELRARHGRAAEAIAALARAERLARKRGDHLTLASAVRWRAAVASQQGDFALSRRLGERLAAIAAAAGDRYHGAWAESILGWADIQAGDMQRAIARYRRAAEAFRALGVTKDEIFVLNGLAAAQLDAGEYGAARASFERTIALTAGTIMRRAYGHALRYLATLEHELGDPAAAVGHYTRVLELFRSRQAWNEIADPLFGLALAHAELGHFGAAGGALDTAQAVAEAYGFRDQVAIAHVTRARVALLAGRPNAALRHLDRGVAMGDTLNVSGRASQARLRALALERLQRPDEAGRVLSEARAALAGRMPAGNRLEVDVALAAHALRRGEAAAPLAAAQAHAAEAGRLGLRELAMESWLVAARAARALGDSAGTSAALDHAWDEWEASRGRPSAPEWRERRGPLARDLVWERVDWLLEAGPGGREARGAAAFEVLQRYKARTLLERIAGPRQPGPAGPALAPATLARVQAALAEGELLLDYLLGEHGAVVFAVTRAGARAARLQGAGLDRRAAFYRELLSRRGIGDRPEAAEARRLAGRRLGADLLGPVAREVAAARSVLVAPDGALHLVPFATLEPPDGAAGPIAERASLATLPSASLLPALRARPPRSGNGPLLAIADSLPGARTEAWEIGAGALGGRWVRLDAGGALAAAELERARAIHFAGHSVPDEQSPWRSAVPFFEREGRPATAADLAGLRLDARLAVLSSCETVDGRVVGGEGVVGLSTAFLAAGVPTVLASLWRVDDHATRALMAAFYDALLWGDDPATALRRAQQTLRAEPATRHPFYWAGFVLIGDGAADPGLLPNPFSPRTLKGYAAGASVVVGTAVATRWFRRRKTAPTAL